MRISDGSSAVCSSDLVPLVGEYDGDGGGGPGDDEVQTYPNDDDFAIEDRQVFRSPVVVADRSGSGLAETEVDVDITHSYIGDHRVDLVAPDRSVYKLPNRSGRSRNDIDQTHTGDKSGRAAERPVGTAVGRTRRTPCRSEH